MLNLIRDIQIRCKVRGENQKLALEDNLFTEVLENLLLVLSGYVFMIFIACMMPAVYYQA